MTINKYLQQISPEDLAYVKRYHHEIQPFRVLPSSTLEFDGQFNGGGETIFTEINLNEDHTIYDMFCTCGAGSLCVHLAAMMYDMVERDTIRLSELENESENRLCTREMTVKSGKIVFLRIFPDLTNFRPLTAGTLSPGTITVANQ